ncbi:MAG: ATP-binding protein [Planctomycetota bacterium]|nr:ATP-binding protein [Planctomycetota bacterium]
MATDLDHDAASRTGLHWALLLRFVLALLGLGGVLIHATWPPGPPDTRFWAALLFILAGLLGVIYFFIWGTVRSDTRFFLGQLATDYFIVTGIIYLTGGPDSIFTFLYYVIILGAALLLSQRFSFVMASAATIGWAGVTTLYHLHAAEVIVIPLGGKLVLAGILNTEMDMEVGFRDPALFLIGQGIAFHLLALAGGLLAERLRRVTLLYELVQASLPEGIVAMDGQQRIAFLNLEARILLGLPSGKEFVGEPVREVLQQPEIANLADLLLTQDEADWEVSLPGDNGPRSVNIRVSANRDAKGRMRGAVAVLTDLTPRKRLEAAERRATHLEGLREVAAGIAHEIRNPLASIRGSVQELARGTMGPEAEKELAEIIYRESDRLDGILGEFLRFTGMRDPVLRKVNIAEILDDVAVLLENRSGVPRGAVQREYEGPYPLLGDRGQLQQVFLNLGLNALEASPEGARIRFRVEPTKIERAGSGRRGRQAAQQDRGSEAIEISVVDEGGGIDEAVLSKIFTPFFTTKSQGTGLGLAVVNRIVRGHEGDVEVANEPGKGCTFRVRLPLERHSPPDER